MRSLWPRGMSSLTALVAAVGIGATSATGADLVYIENVTGAAEITVSSCPWVPPGQAGVVCVDTYVLYFQAGFPGVPGAKEPWSLFVAESTWVSVDEENFEQIDERWGIAPAAEGYVDEQHLTTAAARGTVPMSEGEPIAVDLRWDLSDAGVNVAGKNGPVQGFSWGRSGRSGCMVENFLAHQRWRWDFDGIEGHLGGADIQDRYLPNEWPGVFIEGRSTFKVVLNSTGGKCAAE